VDLEFIKSSRLKAIRTDRRRSGLILGITLMVVILFLSFRKEGYEEELKDWQTQNETIEVPYKMYTKRMIIQIKKG